MYQGLLGQNAQRDVVDHITVFINHAVLAVTRVGVKCYIGEHAELGKAFFELTHHAGYQAVRVHRLGTVERFEGWINHWK